MQYFIHSRTITWIFLLMLLPAGELFAATQVLDRIDISSEGNENIISVHFNVPVRYVSHLTNEAGSEVGIQLQIIQPQDKESNDRIDISNLVESDQLTWNPSADIPLNKVIFQRAPLGTSNLLVSFATPIKDLRISQNRNFYVMDFLLKKQSPLDKVLMPPVSMVDVNVPKTELSLTFKKLSLVIYVINLNSQSAPIDLTEVAPVTIEGHQALYTTVTQIDDHEWHQLRLGYFRTKQEADLKLKAVKRFYPDAWIDQADIQERREALFKLGISLPLEKQEASSMATHQEIAAESFPVDEHLTDMMEQIRRTITAGEFAKAVRMLEAILNEPENYYTKEAMELMGLARERNNQKAHAKADYEAFLEKYPEGEDAERVKQRLLGLITASQQMHESRSGEKDKPVEWRTYGSFSQYYRWDKIDSPLVDVDDSVTRSEIDNYINLNSRYRGKEIDLQMEMSGSYSIDLLDDEDSGNDNTLTELYADVEHLDSHTNMRFGRQRQRSSGIMNRFDGLVLGYEVNPDIRVRSVAGLPVESSRNVSLNEHKKFVGFSGDIANVFENFDLSLFMVEQRVDSLIDRRTVGGELRYFDAGRSLFTMLDYDIHFGALNIFTIQGNWTPQDMTRLYMNFDYRKSPLLQTSTALNGYNNLELYNLNPIQIARIESIDELLEFESEERIYKRAEEMTADTTTLSLGANHSLTDTLQISGDITITKTGATIQQGVDNEPDPNNPGGTRISNNYYAALEETSSQYFYSLQLIKNDLLKQGDIGILSLNYYDTSTSKTLRLGASSRYPFTNAFRVNPRFGISYRQSDLNSSTRLTLGPHLRMDYRLRKEFTLEFDGGINWYMEKSDQINSNYSDYFFQAGYRWNF